MLTHIVNYLTVIGLYIFFFHQQSQHEIRSKNYNGMQNIYFLKPHINHKVVYHGSSVILVLYNI